MTKTVLITGASSGVGRETALGMAKRGWRTALVARRRDRLDVLSQEIKKMGAPVPLILDEDITAPGSPEKIVEKTLKTFGRLDALVNNAGILRMAPMTAMPVAEMREIFETNFWAPLALVRAVIPAFKNQGGGHVVQVGSGVSRRGLPLMAAYAASKFALLGFTESVRLELASHGITFSLVLPGGIDTEMPELVDRHRLPPGYPSHEKSRVSARRAARAVEKAILGRGTEIFVPWWVRPGAWLSALCPSWADKIIRKSYRRIQWK